MVDKIKANLNKYDVRGVNFLAETMKYINPIGEPYTNRLGELMRNGNLDNLFFSASERKLYISNSLCKWYHGNNLMTLTRPEIKKAIEKLSDTIHLPISEATLTSFEFGTNINLDFSPDLYLDYMGELSNFKRHPEYSSITYSKRNKEQIFVLYDKIKELKDKRQPIPDTFKQSNILRSEMKCNKRVKEIFKRHEFKAKDLFNESLYGQIIDQWHNRYKAIDKLNDITINFEKMKGKKAFETFAILTLTNLMGGELEMFQKIKEAQKMEHLTDKQAHDIREKIKKAFKSENLTTKSGLITELDNKINEAYNTFR